MRIAVAAAFALVAAGCLQAPADWEAVEAEVHRAAAPFLVQDHGVERGHHQAALHNGSHNLELVGYHNGADDSGDASRIPPTTWFTEIAVQGGYAYLNRVSRDGATGGFVIVDVNDPRRPRLVGTYEGQSGVDIEVDPEGQYAYIATQRNAPQEVAGALVAHQDPHAAEARGIVVVDISNKRLPAAAHYMPLPYNGPHTVTYVRHADGHDYLVVCTYDLAGSTVPGQPGTVAVTQRVLVYEVLRERGAAGSTVTLAPVGTYQLPRAAPPPHAFMPHDTRVQRHPVTGETLLYVAYWDQGVRILDFDDPRQMREVAWWTDFGPSRLNSIHLVQPFHDLVDGLHVTVAEPEIVDADGETGQLTFLDTTDPSRIRKLGHWTLPEGRLGQLGVQGLDFSPHNFDAFGGKLALAHNHAGVWVLDASTEEHLQDPKSVAFYLPHKERKDSPVMQPRTWGVLAREDPREGWLLYVSDEATGLHILRYTGP
jgi:hypothetical protein